jgi:hypothetical protein
MLNRGVFKQSLANENGKVKIPAINPVFSHNLLKIKGKRLLDIKQPSQ